ncbi:MAG: restriction endonuclease [Hyphomicrobiales bacterium]|nr:restriction endonuclease [Hyphomicrobiales bacterium]
MQSIRIWAVRAGSADEADAIFSQQDQIAISSAGLDDDIGDLPPVRGAFKELLAQSSRLAETASLPVYAGQLYRFVHEVRIGDRVIYPRKHDRTLHWGKVTGPYLYNGDGPAGFAHRRPVEWLGHASRDEFSPGALYELGAAMSFFRVREFALEFLKKFEPDDAFDVLKNCEHLEEGLESSQRDIGETTNDFIASRLKKDLKGYLLEPFVAELFRAMGYRATATRAIKDDGVDVIAHRDELGIEPPILKIQVKSANANINADAVKAFYAVVQDRDVGIIISTGNFTSAARDFAKTKGNLKLMTGAELIALITKYYDSIEGDFRQKIPMKRVLVPDVAMATY